MNITDSYSSADVMPSKVLRNMHLLELACYHHIIPPIHVQFIPTNKCNLSCSFCSCDDEDRSLEASIDDIGALVRMLQPLGTRAVTITGGGEPLIHPEINEIIRLFYSHGIDVGIVTNGTTLRKIEKENANKITWCRISLGDEKLFDKTYEGHLKWITSERQSIDWSFSYVVSKNPDIEKIKRAIRFARDNDFTHIRLVADLTDPENVPLVSVKQYLKASLIDTSKVIFQQRAEPTTGGDCYICYLKPVISADMKVYACCGAQYAIDGREKKMAKELCLGDASDLPSIIEKSRDDPFDGSICNRCYYSSYNKHLSGLLEDINHLNFL